MILTPAVFSRSDLTAARIAVLLALALTQDKRNVSRQAKEQRL